jgi:hypothetical protein
VVELAATIKYTKEDMLSYGKNFLINFEKKKGKIFENNIVPFLVNFITLVIFIINNLCKDENIRTAYFYIEYGFYNIIFTLLISKVICEVNSVDESYIEYLNKIMNTLTALNYFFLAYMCGENNQCCLLKYLKFKNNCTI